MAESADAPSTTSAVAGPEAAEVRGWLGSRLYGITGGAGRAAEVSTRGFEATTTRPAT
jgi:hypothetical protein